MAYTYASNLNGTYETILESVRQIFSADADLFTGFSSNPSYLFADNLRQTMHNYAEFLEGALWLYGAVIVGNDLSEIEAVSLPLSTQDANYLSTRTNGFDTAINYLTTNLKMQPAPLANLTTSGPLIGDPGFETYFSQLDAEVAPSNLLSVQEGTLTDFANAPLSGATLTWVSPNFGTLPFGTGNGIAQVFQLPPEFTFPSIVPVAGVYKSDWQGNQLQYSTPRTNTLLYSDNLTNGVWTLTTGTTTTAGTNVGPDGTTSGGTISYDGTGTSGSYRLYQGATIPPSGESWVASIWLKVASGTLNLRLNNNFNSIPITVTTSWQRFQVSGTSDGINIAQILLYSASGDNSAWTVDYAFAQLEQASSATSYIPTTTAPVTVTDYSLSGSTLTFSIAPISNSSLTWQDASSNIFNFGVGNGSTTVYNLGVEYNPGPSIYKSDWQGNQLQYSTPRTNLVSNGNTPGGTGWTTVFNGTGTAPTITLNYATGPDGTSGAATRLQANQGAGSTVNDYSFLESPSYTVVNGKTYIHSVWLKSNTGSNQPVYMAQAGFGAIAVTVTPAWSRFESLYTATANGTWATYIGTRGPICPANNSLDILVAYEMVEVAQAGLNTPTSYIPTTTSAVTVTDYSLSGSTLTFSTAPISNSSLTWQDASSNVFAFGVGNGSTTVYNLGVEYNPGPSIYKSDWQGNQLQYSTPRTNMLTNSNTFTSWSASYHGTGTAPTVTASYATGPDGISGSASRVQFNQGSGTTSGDYCFITNATVSLANTQYTGSVWIKSNTGVAQPLEFSFSGAAQDIVSVGTSWQRIVNVATIASGSLIFDIGQRGNTSHATTGDFLIAFAQYELSATATSYIPTTTAPVTVTDYSLESSLGVYGISQDETNGWTRIRAALLVSGASYPPNLADTLTFMQNIQQKVTNYGVTYAPTLSNNFPVSAIWNYAICVWTYQDMAAIYSNLPDSQVIQNIQILRYVLKQVELQCAELLTAYRTQAQIPPNTSPLLQSDSLMDLANRALGDYTQWVNIATANGLLPPYTYPTPAPNIASPGTQLFMPGSSTPTNLGNYLLNFLGTDLNWGIPLQSMPVWTGDFETVVGYTNLRWALARRILTPLNSLIYHPEYGSYLSQYLGQPLTNLNLQLILSYTSIALLNDPRIASIVNLTPALTEVNTLLIQASVQPLGIGVTPTQINLTLQPSAISVT